MSLCGRYDFVGDPMTFRVVPYYYKESQLDPEELDQFQQTTLGYYVDAHTVTVGQRCRIKPQIHLGRHLFATLEADAFSDSLQGRFHLWLDYKKDSTYEAALLSFLAFLKDDGIGHPRIHRTEDFHTDLDQNFQYYWMIIQKTPYVAIQPKLESTYLPPYQKPEFYKVGSLNGFERFEVQYYLLLGDRNYWYKNTQDFYLGGGHGFPTRTIWGEEGARFEALVEGRWEIVRPYDIHLMKTL